MNKKECKHDKWIIKAGMLADLYTCAKCGTEKRSWQIKRDKEKTKIITVKEYNGLIKDREWLAAIEAAGVDNWPGLDHARDILDEWDSLK